MKKTLITATLALATLTGAASAMTFSSVSESKIQNYAPDADLSTLSGGEIALILNEIRGSKDDSNAQIRAQVRSLVNAFQ